MRVGLSHSSQKLINNHTISEYIDYWMGCIHTYAASEQFSYDRAADGNKPTLWPPVVIVCTHQDVRHVIVFLKI